MISMGIASAKDDAEGELSKFIQVRHLLNNGGLAPRTELTDAVFSVRGEKERFTTQPGDIILACRGAALRSAIVGEDQAGAIVANNLIRVRLHSDAPLLPEVFLLWFRSNAVQTPLMAAVSGAIGIHLRARDVEAFEVPLLPKNLQTDLRDLFYYEHAAYVAALEAAERRRELTRVLAERQIFEAAE